MKKSLKNVHVVIYSKKMLKQAVDRLKNLNQKVENPIFIDFECHGNDNLIFHDNIFKVVQDLPVNPCYEVTLNDLCEMIIDQEAQKTDRLDIGKWYKHADGKYPNWLVYYGGEIGYGFRASGVWNSFNGCGWYFEKYDFVEATPQEVEQALIAEAQRRGFGRLTKFTMGKFEYSVPQIFHFKYFPESNTLGVNNPNITGVYHHIFQDGKWAEIIEVDKFADLKKAHAEGAVIQYKRSIDNEWYDCSFDGPNWENHTEYRIKPEPKVKMGDYVITELKNQPSPGFSAYQLSIQNSVDVLNSDDCQYNFKIISKEKFEKMRGYWLD